MSDARRDRETTLAAWLADGPSSMPEGLRRSIAARSRATAQHRAAWGPAGRPRVRALRTLPAAGRLLIVIALLGLLLAVILGTAVLGGMATDPLHGIVPPPSDGSYQAIVVRVSGPIEGGIEAIDVVAVQADGRERSIGHLSASDLPAGARDAVHGFVVSPDGWLAFRATSAIGAPEPTHGWAFLDLRHPQGPVRYFEIPWWGGYPSSASGTWGADGRFAGSAAEYHETFHAIDPIAGTVVEIPGVPSTDVDGPTTALDPRRIETLGDGGVVELGGSAWIMTDAADPSRLAIHQSLGPRRIQPDGTVLDVCHVQGPPCARADLHDGAVTTQGVGGPLAIRDVGALPWDRVVDASYANDGSAIWLLLQQGTAAAHPVLARIAAGGQPTTIRDFVPSEQYRGSPDACCSFEGIAPDDSLVALVGAGLPGPIIMSTAVDGPRAWAHEGRFAGFLPSELADALPGGDRVDPSSALGDSTQVGIVQPSSPAIQAPDVVPVPTPAGFELPEGFQPIHTEVHQGTGQPGGGHVTYRVGPFDPRHGLAFALTCLGASEARLTTDLAGDEAWANRCLGGTIGGERAVPLSGDPVTAIVTADPATAWQLTVYGGSPAP